MRTVIDTSSLLSLVRYYIPFDKNNKLFDLVKTKIIGGELIIIDEVLKECEYTAKKIIVETLTFLKDKKFKKTHKVPINTSSIIPPSPTKFYNMLDNQFINGAVRNRLSDIEYEKMKQDYLDSADARMILYSLTQNKSTDADKIIIVTEETEESNDHKTFKKIPSICKILNIEVITLPNLIKLYGEIDLDIS